MNEVQFICYNVLVSIISQLYQRQQNSATGKAALWPFIQTLWIMNAVLNDGKIWITWYIVVEWTYYKLEHDKRQTQLDWVCSWETMARAKTF